MQLVKIKRKWILSMRLTVAADLVQRAYDDRLGGSVERAYDKDGVQAYLLKDRTLVIPGTNDTSDWRRNLNVGPIGRGASGRGWHQGFLQHANRVYSFAAPHRPKLVLGHSLGAAAAQIVAVSLGIPAICFASPRTLRGQRWFRGEFRILNINRNDDVVTRMPPRVLGFRHIGKVHVLRIVEEAQGNHALRHYLRAMEFGRCSPELPENWG